METGGAGARRPTDAAGIAQAWGTTTFPQAWFWQEIGGRDVPWYGRARISAIEPQPAWLSDGLESPAARLVVGVERDGTVHREIDDG